VVLANTFYALCVYYLLNHIESEGKRLQAFYFAKGNIGSQNKEFILWFNSIESSFKNPKILEVDAPINKASGWVRVALSYSIHFLVSSESFKKSIEWIISQKGDTDTNACIMGGILGAACGYNKLELNEQI
jgi:ADP-ribosylglycohydrolase